MVLEVMKGVVMNMVEVAEVAKAVVKIDAVAVEMVV